MGQIILGIDVGTSGIRGCLVKKATRQKTTEVMAYSTIPVPMPVKMDCGTIAQNANIWIEQLDQLLKDLSAKTNLANVTHIIVDATSSTVLLTDKHGQALTDARMYNDNSARNEATLINRRFLKSGQKHSGAISASSTLAKSIHLATTELASPSLSTYNICHQADYINQFLLKGFKSHEAINITDENNALKLGFNSQEFCWPSWVEELCSKNQLCLPQVIRPGKELGRINKDIAKKYGFDSKVKIMAGTTDSIAGFLASGAVKNGDAVSSLGSTLAIKVISPVPVFDDQLGLYSHRLGDNWLVGGASNSGGHIFLNYYTIEQLKQLSYALTEEELEYYLTDAPSYYPLSSTGERFPVADPELLPNIPVVPDLTLDLTDPLSFKQHRDFVIRLCLGLAQVEKLAYEKLVDAGVSQINRIFTVGGGTYNAVWMQFRKALLSAPVTIAENQDAAYGVTLLID